MKKTGSKLLSALMAAAMLITSSVISVSAAQTPAVTLTASKTNVLPGEEITVSVDISNSPGIAHAKFNISYDDSILEYQSCEFNEDEITSDDGAYFSMPPQTVSPLTISYMTLKDVTGDYNCAVLTFKVKDNAAGTTDISITYDEGEVFNLDLTDINPTTVNTSVTVIDTSAENVTQFLGGSLRIDTSTAEKASLRLGYVIDAKLPEGAEIVSWSWKYGFAEDQLSYTAKGEKYTEMSVGKVSNLVLTDIPAAYFKTSYYAQISVVYELDGIQYTAVDDTVRFRNIYDVATAVANDTTESASARAYAQSLLDSYNNQQ